MYALLRLLARASVFVFHRRVVVEGEDRVPESGPIVLASNHPNMMLDVLLLATTQRRKLHFLAKSTLFRNPLLRFVLTRTGTLPVHRRQESTSPSDAAQNTGTFAACHRILASGGAVAIFPEGVSHAETRVLPLKTGLARIVLEAEASHDYRLGVRIVPAGLTFSERELFRADAHVLFGEPFDPAEFVKSHRDGRETRAVRELTAAIEKRLESLTEHLPHEDDAPIVAVLRKFFAPEASRETLSARLEVDRQLVEAVADFRERRPLQYLRLRRRLFAYRDVLALAEVKDEELGKNYRLIPVLRYLAPRTALALVGALPAAAGLLTSYLPYKIPGLIANRPDRHPVERASMKLVLGVVLFAGAYAVQAFAAAKWLGLTAGVLSFLALPFLGTFTLVYAEALSGFLREIRIFFQRGRLGRIEAWRDELALELEQHRREYEASRAAV